MPKSFYTERDIDDLHSSGVQSLEVHDDVVLTEGAKERALKHGIRLQHVPANCRLKTAATSVLFEPLRLRGVEFRNRAFLSPVCQYSAVDGLANEWHSTHYGSRAVGGVGLVMVEATAVSPEGRITPFDLGLWSDEHGRALEPIARFVRAQGATAGVQLAHSGRKGSIDVPWRGEKRLSQAEGGWSPLAPSSLSFRPDERAPRTLGPEDISAIPFFFERAAGRALAAGFQVVEVHMAHGYLLHEFLSPLSNRREDAWGGSWENRVRLPLEVAAVVRQVWPGDLPVFVRISATDWVEGGWDLPQSIRLAAELKRIGIDLVDCSSGGLVPDAKVSETVGYQVPFAAAVRERAGIPTGAVGRITEAAQAEEILSSGQADVVFLGRELLRNPCWPLFAARELGAKVPWPNQYKRAGM